nr:uncharacterized protein LOC127489171 isoform X6 [Oryctolagus cuniculus]
MACTHLADAPYMWHASWGDKLEILFQAWARVQQPLAQQSIHWIEAIEGYDTSSQKDEVVSADRAEVIPRVCGDPPPLERPDVILPILKDDRSYMLCGYWADGSGTPVQVSAEPWHLTTQQPICCAEAIVVENPYHQKEEVELASTDQAEAIPRVGEDPPPLEGPDAIVPVLKDDGSYVLCAYWADEPEAPDQAWARAWHFTTQQPLCCAEAIVVEDSSNKKEKVKGASSDQAEAMSRVGEDPPPLEGPDVIVPILKGDGSYLLCGFWADDPEAPVQACAELWHLATQKPICCAEAIAEEESSCKKEEGDSASAEQAEAIPRVCGDPPPLEGPDAIVPILKEDGSYLLCGYWADEPEAPVQAWLGPGTLQPSSPSAVMRTLWSPHFKRRKVWWHLQTRPRLIRASALHHTSGCVKIHPHWKGQMSLCLFSRMMDPTCSVQFGWMILKRQSRPVLGPGTLQPSSPSAVLRPLW